MKKIIVSGSMAYDRIMNFADSFSEHILPDKIHNLNVCFQVDGVQENFGGTAGNIAYALKLMGESPHITATIGRDYHNYFDRLDEIGLAREGILICREELTAGAYITTDISNNQITGFNPGAMKISSKLDFDSLRPEEILLHVSPGNLEDMIQYPKEAKKRGMSYIFDPGQALPVLQGEDLKTVIDGARLLIVNDYEFSLILDKTGLTREQLLGLAKATIITLGGQGSELYEGGAKTKVKAYTPAKTVDPTGAGDSYRGGLLSGMVQGLDLGESAILGSVCASFAVECSGTQTYGFTKEEFAKRKAEG